MVVHERENGNRVISITNLISVLDTPMGKIRWRKEKITTKIVIQDVTWYI